MLITELQIKRHLICLLREGIQTCNPSLSFRKHRPKRKYCSSKQKIAHFFKEIQKF